MTAMQRVYLDNAATTPLDPRVAAAMLPWLGGRFGNPSSLHREGREARDAVNRARAQVAALAGAPPEDVLFTASGTEAANLALLGAAARAKHILISAFEHPAVMEPARVLAKRGIAVERIPVGSDGIVAPDDVRGRLRAETQLVSVMAANNVAGTLQPIAEIAAICRERGVLLHVDAVQAAGRIPFDLRSLPVDLLSLSAHKIYGPQGVGALIARRELALQPLIHGGGQERGLRSATENVAGIVGFGTAAQLAASEMRDDNARLESMRERLIDGLAQSVPNCTLIGHRTRRLPGHAAFVLEGQEGEAIRLLLALDEMGVAISSGSACSAHHAAQPSYVLTAMGFDAIRARGALRISLGRFNTDHDVDRFLDVFPRAARSLRHTTTFAFAQGERS
jgi:cysteine desulfurase